MPISPQSPEAVKVATLINRLHASGDPIPLTGFLCETAGDLREAQHRISAGSTTLATSLVDALHIVIARLESSSERKKWYGLLEQIGRAAANLAAENDPNRDDLVQAGYPAAILTVLPYDTAENPFPAYVSRAIAASLLNLVVEGHEPALYSLASEESLITLLQFARRLRTTSYAMEKDFEARAPVAGWVWTVVLAACDIGSSRSPPELILLLIDPMLAFIPGPETKDLWDGDLSILAAACEALGILVLKDGADLSSFNLPMPGASHTPLEQLMGFALRGEPPPRSSNETDEHTFARAKAIVITIIVELASVAEGNAKVWRKMRDWLSREERDDLQSCALLSYGNRAREDAVAQAVLAAVTEPIQRFLTPRSSVKLQHAVIGLLKNLSIPAPNKVILGQLDILEKLFDMGVWSTERDIVGSVQGGAVGIVKNLCRDNRPNSLQLLQNDCVTQAILDLIKRTDDAAIGFEATRCFVNAIRSVGSDQAALAKLSERRFIEPLCAMLRQSNAYPVLLNDSIIALALLATFGPKETGQTICCELGDGLGLLCSGIVPSGSFSPEIKANAETLLERLGAGTSEEARKVRRTLVAVLGAQLLDGCPSLVGAELLAARWRDTLT